MNTCVGHLLRKQGCLKSYWQQGFKASFFQGWWRRELILLHRSVEWTKFPQSALEKLDETFSNVRGSTGYQRIQAKKSVVTLSCRGSYSGNIWKAIWHWWWLQDSEGIVRWVLFASENIDYEIFQFRQAIQQPGETIDQFVTQLQKLASTCEFHDASRELKSAVVQNCLKKIEKIHSSWRYPQTRWFAC